MKQVKATDSINGDAHADFQCFGFHHHYQYSVCLVDTPLNGWPQWPNGRKTFL